MLQEKKNRDYFSTVVCIQKNSSCTKIEDLFEDILQVSASNESMDDKSESGSLSQGRRTKTLFGRWTRSTVHTPTLETTPIEVGEGEGAIGRDTIVTCKFKDGRQKDSPMIANDYRVLAVYNKFYNKWFMGSDKRKWGPIMELEWCKIGYLRLLKM